MNNVIYLFLRRLRTPLITLIVVYSISILGFVSIPGQDDQGNVYHMDFFHAAYFVSFMGSTIGFGEIPYAFTPAQRMWTLFSIYATVIAWLYGIGTSLALLQEPMFGRMLRRRSFKRNIAQINEPFYLICGYGVTGSVIVRQLVRRDIHVVVLDIESDRIDALEMDDLSFEVPALCADAALPDVLDDAGLQHPKCIGVMAVTDNDQTNLSIAIASKLLCPDRMVISRTESDITTGNLQSFGTDLVVDPFRTFAQYLSLAAHAPYMHLVYDWIHNPFHRPLSSVYQRTKGRWIICGHGRFGRALYRAFDESDVDLTVVDINASKIQDLPHQVTGVGTEAVTLTEAGVMDAVGIVAGTPNDADNLSIIMTAREMNPKILTVVRQNIHANKLVFKNSRADFIMEPGRIIANRILAHVKSPLVPVFIEQMQEKYDDVWAHTLINRMSSVVGDQELDSWAFTIGEEETPALMQAFSQGEELKLSLFFKNPFDRKRNLHAFPLMLRRGEHIEMLPGELDLLQPDDEILICGLNKSNRRMQWTANNYNVLQYILTGNDASNNLLARMLKRTSS
ncbi:potassium channel protein [Neptuniibacter sp.]|uniref:potassium channel family protein n=1 Tax=Neptuniibacter sp. TaxID=1962643 RepID=UPI0026106D73|nr:potassium channel protein [Neptuniibacter sp.]MCP4595690.1 potassium transporter TrkA [Neptuniibacter sp.]